MYLGVCPVCNSHHGIKDPSNLPTNTKLMKILEERSHSKLEDSRKYGSEIHSEVENTIPTTKAPTGQQNKKTEKKFSSPSNMFDAKGVVLCSKHNKEIEFFCKSKILSLFYFISMSYYCV